MRPPILDLGCGWGETYYYLKVQADVGIDIYPPYLYFIRLRSKTHATVLEGEIEETIKSPHRLFSAMPSLKRLGVNTITLFDVLEHLRLLNLVEKIINSGAMLYLLLQTVS